MRMDNLARTAESPGAMEAPGVEAAINYLADVSVKPVTYNPPQGTGLPRRVGNYGSFVVRIEDARALTEGLSLDRQAFKLTRHETAVRNFYDEAEIRSVYYPEMERLVK